jgi:hypothetical protein
VPGFQASIALADARALGSRLRGNDNLARAFSKITALTMALIRRQPLHVRVVIEAMGFAA